MTEYMASSRWLGCPPEAAADPLVLVVGQPERPVGAASSGDRCGGGHRLPRTYRVRPPAGTATPDGPPGTTTAAGACALVRLSEWTSICRSNGPWHNVVPRKSAESQKQAMAAGRVDGRIVKNYLEALDQHRPKRGRKRTPRHDQEAALGARQSIAKADPLSRLSLIQQRIDLSNELESPRCRGRRLRAGEVRSSACAKGYGERKGITLRRLAGGRRVRRGAEGRRASSAEAGRPAAAGHGTGGLQQRAP